MRSYGNQNNNNKDNKQSEQKSNDAIMKRPLTLDLNKKLSSLNNPAVLSTPDVNLCKLASPDLENFILNTDTLQTPSSLPTPSTVQTMLQPSKVTSEQEEYAKGFEEALKNIHNNELSNVSQNVKPAPTMSGGGITSYSDSENTSLLMQQIKEEPQQPASPQQLNPIDMESQERIKLERKRQRNRVAASKCRKRKLERISKLEDRVKVLKVENHDLASVLHNLKQHVFDLKQQVINHHQNGCHIKLVKH